MLTNAFIGKPEPPTDRELAAVLGRSKALWGLLLTTLANECDISAHEWSSYSRKAGWSLKVKREQRTILYLSPSRGSFMASFALGDKAIQAARQSRLPQRVVKVIDEAKRYAEGTAVRIDVNRAEDIEVIQKLAKAKLEN
jgi:hypothetical protein